MGKECTNKNAFYKNKHLIDIDKIDTDKMVKSSKDSCTKKG